VELNGHLFEKARKKPPVVFGYTWGDFSSTFLGLQKIDVILGADCFYDNSPAFDDILASVAFVMKKNHAAVFLTTYQVRSATRSIVHLLDKWGLKGEVIPLNTFMPPEKITNMNQEIELVRITINKQL